MIELKNINITITGKKILEDLSASSKPGELTLLLGENGAGKTTLLNYISGIINPDSGSLLYEDKLVRPESPEFNSRISYIRDDGATIPLLSVEEQLMLQCFLNDLNRDEAAERINNTIELLNLQAFRNYRAEELSAGVRKKLGIALGLVNEAEIFLFDEPFSSLDYKSSAVMVEILKILKKRGRFVILSTHTPQILSGLANRIWMLSGGAINEMVSPEKIRAVLTLNEEERSSQNSRLLSWI